MPEAERLLHLTTEIIAVLVIVPFLTLIMSRYALRPWERTVMRLIIIGTLLVDGYLALRWLST